MERQTLTHRETVNEFSRLMAFWLLPTVVKAAVVVVIDSPAGKKNNRVTWTHTHTSHNE